jgi:predicted glycoside hydrolase/deacetylase ChbG (UPF0249 family)
MSKLIINADDFGLCESVNQGIIECYSNGLVSDLSFLINPGCFDVSVKQLNKAGITSSGIHFNLTLGRSPVSKNNSITDASGGYFTSKYLFKKFLAGDLNDKDIYIELKSQLNRLLKAGIEVTHFDSHQNIHLIPQVYHQMNRLMEEFNMKVNVRIPTENIKHLFNIKPSNLKRIVILNFLSIISRHHQNRRQKIYTIGGDFFNNENPSAVFNRIISLIQGDIHKKTYEMAVHPGYFSQEILRYDSYGKERETELGFLRSISKNDMNNKLQIISFAEHQKALKS